MTLIGNLVHDHTELQFEVGAARRPAPASCPWAACGYPSPPHPALRIGGRAHRSTSAPPSLEKSRSSVMLFSAVKVHVSALLGVPFTNATGPTPGAPRSPTNILVLAGILSTMSTAVVVDRAGALVGHAHRVTLHGTGNALRIGGVVHRIGERLHEFDHLQIRAGRHHHVAAELRGLAADRCRGVRRVPIATPPGAVMREAEPVGVVRALRDAVDGGGPVGAGRRIEVRGRAFGESAEIGEPFAEARRIGLRDVQLDGAAGPRESARTTARRPTSTALAITG